MTLKELIRKRIEENVPDYDITKIERYEYLIEMIAIEHAGEVVKNISSKPVLCDSLPPSTVDFNSQICWDENQDGKLPPSI